MVRMFRSHSPSCDMIRNTGTLLPVSAFVDLIKIKIKVRMCQLDGKSYKIDGESYKSIPTSEFRVQAY